MYRGTIPAAWADQGPAHEAIREPEGPAAQRRSAAARLFEAKRPRGAGIAGGEIITPPHFRGTPRRFRSNRPSPGWFCASRERQTESPETITCDKLSGPTDQIGGLRPQAGHVPTEPSVPGMQISARIVMCLTADRAFLDDRGSSAPPTVRADRAVAGWVPIATPVIRQRQGRW